MPEEQMRDELLRLEERLWTGGPDDYRAVVDDECLVAFTSYRALVSSGYVRRDGAWKLMFHQQTPLSD